METMEVHVGKVATRLNQWGVKRAELVASAELAGTEARIDYRRRIDELQSTHQVAQSKLDEIFKAGVACARNDLEATFQNLMAPFRSVEPSL